MRLPVLSFPGVIDLLPVQPTLAVQDVALVEVQFKVAAVLYAIVVEPAFPLAVRVTVGFATGGVVTVTALVVLHMIDPLLITTSARTVALPAAFACTLVTYAEALSTAGVTLATVALVEENRTSLTVPLAVVAVAVKFMVFGGFILSAPAGDNETVHEGTGGRGVGVGVNVGVDVGPAH